MFAHFQWLMDMAMEIAFGLLFFESLYNFANIISSLPLYACRFFSNFIFYLI